jgi:uncharacterized membrane protein
MQQAKWLTGIIGGLLFILALILKNTFGLPVEIMFIPVSLLSICLGFIIADELLKP